MALYIFSVQHSLIHKIIDLMWISLVYCIHNKFFVCLFRRHHRQNTIRKKGCQLRCHYSCIDCVSFSSQSFWLSISARWMTGWHMGANGTCSRVHTMHTQQMNTLPHMYKHIFHFSICSRTKPIEMTMREQWTSEEQRAREFMFANIHSHQSAQRDQITQ